MNEVMNNDHNFSMQELANLIGAQAMTVNKIIADISGFSQRFDKQDQSISELRDELNSYEITTNQCKVIKDTVFKTVSKLLDLPFSTKLMNDERLLVCHKYRKAFIQRCYREVSRKGHLASPYSKTPRSDYVQAIKDIEAWTPSDGIDGLKSEIDRNAKMRLLKKELGYK